ncbi:MAG TPA: RNA polymerase sigma factor [Polyangiaceae bacterium]
MGLGEFTPVGMLTLLMPNDANATPAARPDSQSLATATADLRPHVRAVIAAMLGVGRDHPDVEDCAHEALRRAIEGRDRLREGEPLRPWVTGIARHVALDAMRARKRQRDRTAAPARDADGEPVNPLDQVADTGPSPFDRLADARRKETIARALGALPEGQRRALTMFHMEGLQYQEIAARLGVPLGTVATWVMRARKSVAAAAGVAEES